MATIRIPARTLIPTLHAVAATLVISFLASHALKLYGYPEQMGFRRLLNLDAEGTLPAWFTSSLMLGAAALLAVIAAQASHADDRYRWHWWILSAGFFYMSADETASIHEMTHRFAVSLPFDATGPLTYPWVVIGGTIALFVGVTYLRFLRVLPPAARRGFVVAGTCYVGGALGMEMVGAWLVSAEGLALQLDGWQDRGDFPVTYALAVALEEGLEMFGLILFLRALLGYCAAHIGRIGIEVDN